MADFLDKLLLSDRSTRAGRYIRQPTGYRAFIPATLPPDPAVQMDSEMQHLLSEADRALGRLEGSIQTLPNPDLFVFMYARKEAVLSSQIEGTQASINDLLKAEAEVFDSSSPKDVDEVLNYVKAMNYGLGRLDELPLSIRLIKEIHSRLLEGVRGRSLQPGELRRSQNWIGPAGSTLLNAIFIPPPYQEAEAALGDLEKFLHVGDDHLPPLIKIGLAHAQFETIHPFLDGNGRVGRLLITFFLCQQGILTKPVLYLSYYFKQNRTEYYELLQRVRDKGDWEAWLKFFLRGVGSVAAQATQTARNIVALREEHRTLVMDRLGTSAANAIRLLEHLYKRPNITVNQAKDLLGISYPNANNLIEKLCENKILYEITGQARNRLFFYTSYVDLFASL
ncbi:MAG: Fic family protein [Variibacter sp.]